MHFIFCSVYRCLDGLTLWGPSRVLVCSGNWRMIQVFMCLLVLGPSIYSVTGNIHFLFYIMTITYFSHDFLVWTFFPLFYISVSRMSRQIFFNLNYLISLVQAVNILKSEISLGRKYFLYPHHKLWRRESDVQEAVLVPLNVVSICPTVLTFGSSVFLCLLSQLCKSFTCINWKIFCKLGSNVHLNKSMFKTHVALCHLEIKVTLEGQGHWWSMNCIQ